MASRDLHSVVSEVRSIAAAAYTAVANGAAAALAGYESALILVDLGVFAGTTPTATVQIEESDDNVTFTAVAATDLHGGVLPAITPASANQLYARGYRGNKKHIRVALTAIAGAGASLPLSAVIVRGDPWRGPTR